MVLVRRQMVSLQMSHGLGTVSDGLGNVYVYVYEKKGNIMKIFTNGTKAS